MFMQYELVDINLKINLNMMWEQMTSKRASMILNEGLFSELVHGEFLFVFEDSACLS